jgi:hypothetical protein
MGLLAAALIGIWVVQQIKLSLITVIIFLFLFTFCFSIKALQQGSLSIPAWRFAWQAGCYVCSFWGTLQLANEQPYIFGSNTYRGESEVGDYSDECTLYSRYAAVSIPYVVWSPPDWLFLEADKVLMNVGHSSES